MSWVTIVWSMEVAACLTLAVIHLVIWGRKRSAWANLLFAGVAISVAGMAVFEFLMMRAQTPTEFSAMNRRMHVTAFATCFSIVWFIRVYLRAGRLWFLWSVIILRALVLALNFLLPLDINYREIHALIHPMFLGEPISVAQGVRSSWSWFDEVTALWLIAFVVDASILLWRRGGREERRRALVVGGSMALFVLVALTHVTLVRLQLIRAPQIAGFTFMLFIAAMAFEMSRDLLRAAQLADELRESEQRMKLASHAARLGMWTWDVVRDEVWITDEGRVLFGWTKSEPVNFEGFVVKVHPEDREATRNAVQRSLSPPGVYDAEYRVQLADGTTRWISGRGHVEFNDNGQAVRLRGVSIDITSRKQAEAEAQRQRAELAHVARVSTLGQLTAALAHELNQPLGAILRNAEAAELLLKSSPPDLAEIRAILADIRQDDQRAGQVIDRLRALLKRRTLELQPVHLRDLALEVATLTQADAATRRVSLLLDLPGDLPPVRGDRVHLQQVLLNLLLNGMDAMSDTSPEHRRLVVSACRHNGQAVELSVSDSGAGIPAEHLARLFEPFFTTKPHGMGMGLSIARTIIEAHSGRIWAENNASGGATFRFRLPVAAERTPP